MPGAFSDWSAADSVLLGSAGLAIYGDVQTTKDGLSRGGQEGNPLFGTPHPSGAALDQGALAGAALTTAIAGWLSPQHRKEFLAGVTGFEGALANQNSKISGDSPKQSFAEALATPALTGLSAAGLAHIFNDANSTLSGFLSGDIKHPGFGLQYRKDF